MIIERQQGQTLIAWLDEAWVQPGLELLLLGDGEAVQRWSGEQIVLESLVAGRRYLRITLESEAQAVDLLAERLHLEAHADGRSQRFKVFAPLRETLKLRELELSRLGSTFKLLPGPQREALRRAVEYGTQPHARSAVQRQRACVITYANDSGGWFEVFRRHYTEQLGDSAHIHVVTPQPESFAGQRLGGLTGLRGFAYDDFARSQLLSGMARALSAYYEWVIVADVDELIFADASEGLGRRTLRDRLGDPGLDAIHFSLGMDIVQADDESDFDSGRPLFAQRRYAVPNSGMCKPHISRGCINLDIGFHYCQVPPKLPSPGQGFLMFHLKYACSAMRGEVARMVERTGYTDQRIKTYAYDSVGRRTAHPGLQTATPETAVPLAAWNREAFAARIASHLVYDADRDLHVGRNFTEDLVLDLKGAVA